MSRFQLGLQNLDFPLTAYEFHCQSSSLPTTMLPTFLLVTLLDFDFDETTRVFFHPILTAVQLISMNSNRFRINTIEYSRTLCERNPFFADAFPIIRHGYVELYP